MTDDDLEQALAEWTEDAIRSDRVSRRWQEQVTSETATFNGALSDLHEASTAVRIETLNGRLQAGVIGELGADFVLLIREDLSQVYVARQYICSIRVEDDARKLGPAGNRSVSSGARLVERLSDLAAKRSRLVYTVAHANDLRSATLVSVGEDVVRLSIESGPATLMVRADQISEFYLA